ncbi:MAG: hypothetical protein ACE5IY_11710 [bacterium]
MDSLSVKKQFVYVLILSLLSAQNAALVAGGKAKQIRAAFIGLDCDDLPQEIEETLAWRINAILESEDALLMTKPDAARIAYGREKLAALLAQQDSEAFRTFADKYQFDHVFSGRLRNTAAEGEPVHLVGELTRYDLATGSLNTYMIDTSYEKVGNDLVRFKEQYVRSLFSPKKKGLSPWPILLLGGTLIAGVVAFSLKGESSGGGEVLPPASDQR